MRNRPHTLVNEIILYRRPPIFGNAKRLLRARRTHSEYSKQMAQVDGRAEKKRRRMWKTTVINERTRVSDVKTSMHRASMICGRCFSMFCFIPMLIDASMFDKTSGVEFHNIAQQMVSVPHGQIPGFCFNLPCLRNAEISRL